MRNRKLIQLLFVCIAVLVCVMIFRSVFLDKENPSRNQITMAQVARSVALLEASKKECEAAQNHFDKLQEWYVPYMNQMYEKGYFKEKEIIPAVKEAKSAFTYRDLEQLLENMDISDKEVWSYVKNNRLAKNISQEEWTEILFLLANLCNAGDLIQKETLIVTATKENLSSLSEWIAVTSEGNKEYTGLSLDVYIDKEVMVLWKDEQILSVGKVVSKNVTYSNVYISSMDNGKMNAFVYGAARTFEVDDLSIATSNTIGDISLKSGKVKKYQLKSEQIGGKLLKYTDHSVEIEGKGNFALAENFQAYQIYGNVQQKTLYDMVVGYDVQRFVISDGKVCAVLIDRNFTAQNIRVVIKTNGFSETYHQTVCISSEKEFQLKYGTETKNFSAGEEVEITLDSEYLQDGKVQFISSGVDGKLMIKSLERGYGTPSYRGTLEISKSEQGLLLINELSLEEYLYAVVPSEMPHTYHIEALKAQAVCARTYACKQILSNSYADLGAHVDDSTSFQVYNNSLEQPESTQAVKDTYGEILTYENEPISAFFYSTSCGSGADATIWGGSGYPYIQSKLFTKDNKMNASLKTEEDFLVFITNDYGTYDSEYPWYRWNLTMSLAQMTEIVNQNLHSLYQSAPQKVLTLEGNDYISKEVKSVGNVLQIEVCKRGNGGVLEEIMIHGDKEVVKIQTESFIRKIFCPYGLSIQKMDGTKTETLSMLPSAFFSPIEVKENGVLTGYKFAGGGYGHGAGMSQNGANTLGKEGVTYQNILTYYYTGIKMETLYEKWIFRIRFFITMLVKMKGFYQSLAGEKLRSIKVSVSS